MCRNIKTLFNFAPPATDAEVNDAALQYVRKLSGTRKPSKVNEAIFDQAVHDIFLSTRRLIDSLVTQAEPRSREEELRRAKERSSRRFGEARSPK